MKKNKNPLKKIVIFGGGGHAKVIIDIIEKQNLYQILFILEASPTKKELLGYPIISENDFFQNHFCQAGIIAIGDNFIRSKVAINIHLNLKEFHFISAIHPSAQIARNVTIGDGTCVMANASINTDTHVGQHNIINTNSSVDHDCRLADFVSIAPNSSLGGNCQVGLFGAISIGANIIHSLSIGENTVIGAGATLVKPAEAHKLYVGTPAKAIKCRLLGQKYLS